MANRNCLPSLYGPLATAASFKPLGDLPGGDFFSSATGVSADGGVVVGLSSSNLTAAGSFEAFRWTPSGGMSGLGSLAQFYESRKSSIGRAVSDNGEVIVGQSGVDNLNPATFVVDGAFRWTEADGMTALGDISGPGISTGNPANDVSGDGTVIVGGNYNQAFRWSAGTGMQGLGFLPSYDSSGAAAVSADGSVIVGLASRSITGQVQAFRWTAASGLVAIGAGIAPVDVSADGSIVVGNGNFDALRWTASEGWISLGDLPGATYSVVFGVSGDGSVMGGASVYNSGPSEAVFWTQAGGVQSLLDYLVANGVTGLAGWTLSNVSAVSADGRWLVGAGTNPLGQPEGFIADITPVPLPASALLLISACGLLVRRRGGVPLGARSAPEATSLPS